MKCCHLNEAKELYFLENFKGNDDFQWQDQEYFLEFRASWDNFPLLWSQEDGPNCWEKLGGEIMTGVYLHIKKQTEGRRQVFIVFTLSLLTITFPVPK